MKAIQLRRQGESIQDIAIKLDVSKGSVSAWCRDASLTPKQQEVLHKKMVRAGHAGRMLGAAANRNMKLDRQRAAYVEVKRTMQAVSKRDLLMLGLGIYWGEGSKSDDNKVSVSNSDPSIIAITADWLTQCLKVEKSDFKPRIYINSIHRQREEKLIMFWSELLGVPQKQFGKTVFLERKNKKMYDNHESYYGVLSLGVAKPGVLKYKIMGMLSMLVHEK